jgi:predicted TIM-barrel fold metal-dependent hydrolase
MAAYMLRHIGLGGLSLDAPDFDERYTAHLLRLVRESSVESIVLLAQDEVYENDGRKMEGAGSFHVPNDVVLRLAREHPEFLPAVSIHPARPGAIEELDRCIAGGAVMLKLLPNCHNVDCNDPRYRRFWERMAEARLPLLAHTGGEYTVQVMNAAYSDPRVLTLPLECGVTVIAAHAATKSGFGDPEYFHTFAEMLPKWPNLYGDTSAWHVPLRGRHANRCVGPGAGLLRERLLHGSDFPVPCNGVWAMLRRYISFADYRRCARITNVIERDYQLKLAMGFDADHFTRIRSLLRWPSGRDPRSVSLPRAA